MHSPFTFDFIQKVLRDNKKYPCYDSIELVRKKLLQDHQIITVEDFGAGSSIIKNEERKISAIASSSLKPKKYAQLLFRIVQYYQPSSIIELGTSFGLSTAYMANGNSAASIYTCEGAKSIAKIAAETFTTLMLPNIKLITGDFNQTLPDLLKEIKKVDLAFIDGNHRKEPTLQYFQQLLECRCDESIFIFDDIHWSAEMEAAWKLIQQHPAVTSSIDLFFIGIVFFRTEFKVPRHFYIRF